MSLPTSGRCGRSSNGLVGLNAPSDAWVPRRTAVVKSSRRLAQSLFFVNHALCVVRSRPSAHKAWAAALLTQCRLLPELAPAS
jgi:hypothetical protein